MMRVLNKSKSLIAETSSIFASLPLVFLYCSYDSSHAYSSLSDKFLKSLWWTVATKISSSPSSKNVPSNLTAVFSIWFETGEIKILNNSQPEKKIYL